MTEIETEIQASDERPQWLPEQFKSPEALVQSYSEAQRKITEQGQALAEMAARLEGLEPDETEAQVSEEELLAALETTYPEELARLQAMTEQSHGLFPGLNKRQALELLAQHAIGQVDQVMGRSPGQLDRDHVIALADSMSSENIAGWDDEAADRVEQTVLASPDLHARAEHAIASGDPASLAVVFLDAQAASAVALAEENAALRDEMNHRAKMAAQSATGAGPGRIEAPTQGEWGRIAAAGRFSPWTS